MDSTKIKEILRLSEEEKAIASNTVLKIASLYFLSALSVFLLLSIANASQLFKIILVVSILAIIPFAIWRVCVSIARYREKITVPCDDATPEIESADCNTEGVIAEASPPAPTEEDIKAAELRRIEEEEKAAEAKRIEEERIAEENRIEEARIAEEKRLREEREAEQRAQYQATDAIASLEKIVSELKGSYYFARFFGNLYELDSAVQKLYSCRNSISYPNILEKIEETISEYESSVVPYIEKRIFSLIEEQIKRHIQGGNIRTPNLKQVVRDFERNISFLSDRNKAVISQLRKLVDDSEEYDVEKINKVYVYAIDGIFDELPRKVPPVLKDSSLDEVDSMDGIAFERWCAALLASNGFSNVEVTKASHDQGVDILASKDEIRYAIQCKCYTNDLDNTPVQEIVAGRTMYHCQIGVVMTNRGFTAGAIDAARSNGVLLWGREKLQEMLQQASQ